MCKKGELWIARVNKLICKIVKEEAGQNEQKDGEDNEEEAEIDIGSLCGLVKKNSKYVQKEITDYRLKVEELIKQKDESSDKQLVMRLKQHSRRLIALEMLFLTLCPLVLIPEARKDKQVISETLEELEELKECYGNLGMQDISSLTSTKKAKKGESDKQ